MELNFKCVICAVIILAVLPEGLLIKCWDCRSDLDPKCGHPFDNTTLPITDCKFVERHSHVADICRKRKQKVNGEWHIIRDCAFIGEDGIKGDKDLCVTREGPNNTLIEYCTCNSKDGCNSSFMFNPTPLFVLAGLSAAIIKNLL